jgi:hypothetical protein
MTADQHRERGPRPPAARAGDDGARPAGDTRSDAADRAGPKGADGGRGLVRVTVNLTPRAVDSLAEACLHTHDSKTDTINRALVVYNLVLALLERSGGSIQLQTKNGVEHVHLL